MHLPSKRLPQRRPITATSNSPARRRAGTDWPLYALVAAASLFAVVVVALVAVLMTDFLTTSPAQATATALRSTAESLAALAPARTPTLPPSATPVPVLLTSSPHAPQPPTASASPDATTASNLASPNPSATVGAPGAATPTATLAPVALDAASPLATPTSPTIPVSTATPTPTATLAPGWSFLGLHTSPDPESGGLFVYSDVANNTGATQELATILGKFYDAQGNVIADENSITDYYWPISIIPAGARVPIYLLVPGVQEAARFELAVDAQPTTQTVHQDFEFSMLNQSNEGDLYCVSGTLRNPGDAIGTYLIAAAILWDGQDNMINWERAEVRFFGDLVGDSTADFKICIPPPNQGAVRYELRAWGN